MHIDKTTHFSIEIFDLIDFQQIPLGTEPHTHFFVTRYNDDGTIFLAWAV